MKRKASFRFLRAKTQQRGKTSLRAADLDSVRAFVALTNLEREHVALAKIVKRDADELGGVEEEILLLAIALDEPESLISETGDSSFLHSAMRNIFVCKYQVQVAGVEARSSLLWISSEIDTVKVSPRLLFVNAAHHIRMSIERRQQAFEIEYPDRLSEVVIKTAGECAFLVPGLTIAGECDDFGAEAIRT